MIGKEDVVLWHFAYNMILVNPELISHNILYLHDLIMQFAQQK